MADYRLYFNDGAGHILSAIEFVCDDDQEAVERARARLGGLPGELWQRARRVRTFGDIKMHPVPPPSAGPRV